jgi:8-oxo-dGTP pyrophosphatase MutT (NUDIX family)
MEKIKAICPEHHPISTARAVGRGRSREGFGVPGRRRRRPFLYTFAMTPPRIQRLSAGVVVVRQSEQGWRFLLLRAFNHWDFPKGMVEPGEEPLAAALREVREESLIDDLEFAWGQCWTQTGPYSRGKVARYFIARTGTSEITLPVNPELGRPEHSEFRWVDFDEATELVSPRVRPVLHWAGQVLNLGGETDRAVGD